jgi:hypothetical protein
MRDILHKFLWLCGATLVVLRFLPAKPGGFLSRLFFDEAVHNHLAALSMKVILSMGVTVDKYQTQLAGLTSLANVSALIVEALGIALIFYIITRWI